MIVRTSNIAQNQNNLTKLMAQQNKLLEMQAQADSEKKVNTLSDNPQEISTIMNLNKQLAQISSYYKNIAAAQNQLSMTDDIFEAMNKKLDRINDLGLQLLNGTNSAETVSATKLEIDQLVESVVDTANQEYNGEYLFSGAKVNVPPYEITRDADGKITAITYNGTKNGEEGWEKKLEISNGMSVTVNGTGDKLFGSYNAGPPEVAEGLLGSLAQISNIVGAYPNGGAGDYPDMDAYNADLERAMGNLETNMKNVNKSRSDFGARSSRLTLTQSSLEDLEMSSLSHKSSIVDLDMVEALSNLVQQNYAYQASMQTYMMLQQNSLLNYL